MTDPKQPDVKGTKAGAAKGRSKKTYKSPELTEYGSVAKLTLGSLTVQSDSPLAGKKKAGCL